MLQNQKGQTLLTVMLVSLIFTVMGVTIIASTLGGTNRTEIRIDDINLTAKATKALNENIAQFQKELLNEDKYGVTNIANLLKVSLNLTSLTSKLAASATNANGTLSIKDISKDMGITLPQNVFTRAYEFSYTAKEGSRSKTIKKKIYLSPTPSFLNYAAGTGPAGTMELNGASEFNGNIFTNILTNSNAAKYKNITEKTALTRYPKLNGKAIIRSKINGESNLTKYSLLKTYFDDTSNMVIQRDTANYLPLEFESSIAQVLNAIIGKTLYTADQFLDKDNIPENDDLDKDGVKDALKQGTTTAINSLLQPCKNPLPNLPISIPVNGLICQGSPVKFLSGIIKSPSNENIIYTNLSNGIPVPGPFFIQDSFLLDKTKWVIVNGDLEVSSRGGKSVELTGNIIVTGDLNIIGDSKKGKTDQEETAEDDEIKVNSTIYVFGKTNISNTNIVGKIDSKTSEPGQLVVMSQSDLTVTRINEFKKLDAAVKPLDTFLYTATNAELYGVGSLFKINGGIFAEKKLTINAIRQNSIGRDFQVSTPSVQAGENSRFQVTYNPRVIINQRSSLPRVKTYQIITSDTIINRK